MKILKLLLLSVIALSIKENNCQSMESVEYNNNTNSFISEKDALGIVFSDIESDCKNGNLQNDDNKTIKQLKNNLQSVDINNNDQYKHIFDKKYNEEYYEKIRKKCYDKYENNEEYEGVIRDISKLSHEIYSLYFEPEYDEPCIYQSEPSFYEVISYENSLSKDKIARGDCINVINYSDLMKYAKLFDSLSFENKFNNQLLANNNVENLNKYISENKETNEISYLKFIHYMANNTKKLEAQMLEMIYNNQLNSSNYIVLRQYPKIIHSVIEGLKNFSNIAEKKYKEKYGIGLLDDDDDDDDDDCYIPVSEFWISNYNINKLYFKFRFQNNDGYNKIKELVNNFNILHNTVINDLNKILQDVYNYKIPNNFVIYGPIIFRNCYERSKDVLKSFTFLRERMRSLLFTKLDDNFMMATTIRVLTFLDTYLKRLITSLNQLQKSISIDIQNNINNMYKNNTVDVSCILNNAFFYVDAVADIFEHLKDYFKDNKLLLSEKCTSMTENFYKIYSNFPSVHDEHSFILINDNDNNKD